MIRSFSEKIVQGVAAISVILTLLLPLAIMVDVLSRALFNNPLVAVFEGAEYAILWIPMLAAPYITMRNEHIVVDLIDGLFKKQHGELIRTIVQIIGAVLSLIAVSILMIMAWDSVIGALQSGTRMNTTLAPPRWIINSILPVGMSLTGIVLAVLLVGSVAKLIRRKQEGVSTPVEG